MADRTAALPVSQQCRILQRSRSSVYRPQRELPEADLALMRRIDEPHLEHPFLGSRQLRDCLRLEGHRIGRKRVRRLMGLMGIEAIYRRKNTSKRHPQHPVFPYLLRGMSIDRPNQVWAMDLIYLPMRRGFVYLAVVLDSATRRVLSFRLSNSLTTDFCVEAVEEAIARAIEDANASLHAANGAGLRYLLVAGEHRALRPPKPLTDLLPPFGLHRRRRRCPVGVGRQ